MTAPWKETSLQTILTNYETYIYNTDEFGLFYQSLPQKILNLKKTKSVPMASTVKVVLQYWAYCCEQ